MVVVPEAAAVVQVRRWNQKSPFFRREAEAAPREASVKIEVACHRGSSGGARDLRRKQRWLTDAVWSASRLRSGSGC